MLNRYIFVFNINIINSFIKQKLIYTIYPLIKTNFIIDLINIIFKKYYS